MTAPAPPPGWPTGAPPVPSVARLRPIGPNLVAADMPYRRWLFGAKGLVSFTAYDGKSAGTVTKGPGA